MNIREANAMELVKIWTLVTGAPPMAGRDAKIFKELLDGGYTAPQLVQAMRDYEESGWTRSVHWFRQHIDDVVEDDALVAETRLCEWLSGKLAPHCFLIYMDLREGTGGIPQPGLIEAFDTAKSELERWVDDTVSNSTNYSRTGLARMLAKGR